MRLDSLIGRVFDQLVVPERADDDAQSRPTYTCRCDCGRTTEPVRARNSKSGKTSSTQSMLANITHTSYTPRVV